MKNVIAIVSLAACCLLYAPTASACSCPAILPAQAFDKAQAVFTGKVIKSKKKEWTVAVARVWKGEIAETIVLRDAHAESSCAASFKSGECYLFLIDVNESGGGVVYSPQVCNWTTRLKSSRLDFGERGIFWTEDLVLTGRGEGSLPLKKKAVGK